MDAQRIELTTWECVRLLREQTIGRLCIIENGYPLAMPINYRIAGDDDDIRVVVRTAPASIVGRYRGPGSLQVDQIDLPNGTAWSVIVRGTVQQVVGAHDLPDPDPMVSDGRHQWITLNMSAITGRRFVVRPSTDGFTVEWQFAVPI